MKLLLVFALIFATALALPSHNADSNWQQYKSAHRKTYKTPEDEQKHYESFVRKLDEIKKHNAKYEQGLITYKKGINRFSDWTPEEISALLTPKRVNKNFARQKNHTIFRANKVVEVPDKIDWRDEGAVTAVKDEGENCAGGWSFSATGALEGLQKIVHNEEGTLSEQNLIDCVSTDEDRCSSAVSVGEAFGYVRDNGIETEDDYPYYGEADEACSFICIKSSLTIEDYDYVADDDEDALKEAVAVQPISVKIEATCDFLDYESGIFEGQYCSSEWSDLNLWALVVGYGSENGTDYWIVKISWGEEWGEEGYIRMIRNKDNHCGIASYGIYPSEPTLIRAIAPPKHLLKFSSRKMN